MTTEGCESKVEGLSSTSTETSEDKDEDLLTWSVEEVRAAQRRDNEINFVMDLLQNSIDKPLWNKVEMHSYDVKSLYSEWERLVIVDGILFRK